MNWKPIDTAPIDKRIIITDGTHIEICRLDRFTIIWLRSPIEKPTHWMHLPALPEKQK